MPFTPDPKQQVNLLSLLIGKSFQLILCFGLSIGILTLNASGQSSGLLKELNNPPDQYADIVECFVEFIPKMIRFGEPVKLKLLGRVKEGYYIYSIFQQGQYAPDPTQLIIDSSHLKVSSELVESKTVLIKDEAFDTQLNVHKNDFWLEQKYQLQNPLNPGSYTLNGSLFYQVCNSKICSLPIAKKFSVQLEIIDN